MDNIQINSETVKQLFPNLASAKIVQKQGVNGTPFYIEDGENKYWLKLVNSTQMEDSLKDVERQSLQEIKSPHVIELVDVRTKVIQGQRYDGLLFNFIEGEDLFSIFSQKKNKGQPFTEGEARKLLLDVGEGIQAIASKGWVHQDIKQKNIRYDKNNDQYVILDFGLAYYAKDLQSPNGKYNRDYASAEQAYASVDNDKIPLITFRSDISQLGQLVYELLTLQNPFKDKGQSKLNLQRIIKGEYVPLKDLNKTISTELVKIIDTMLNPHPGYRFRTVEELLCALEGKPYIQQSSFEKGVFLQVWKGPQGFIKNIAQAIDEIQGVVVSASQMPSSECIDLVKSKKLKLIFDPETFLLTKDVNASWHGGMSSLNWYDYPLSPEKFKDKNKVADFVSRVVQSQIDLGVDYIIPPYFCISNPDCEWRNLNGIFYHECLQYCRRISLDKPVICPIAVSQAVVTVDRSRKELVDYYSQLPELQGFFLRIDAKEHNTSVALIQSIRKLIGELEHHKPVLLADAGTVVFGYFADGLSACVTSLVDSRRESDLASKQVDKTKGGSYKEKYFIPKIFQFVKVEGELPALIKALGSDILCDCSVCHKAKADKSSLGSQDPNAFVSKWGKIDRGNHFFCCVNEWRVKMQSITPEKRIEEYKKIIDDSRTVYLSNTNNLIFNQIIKRDDSANWEVAFFSQ